MKSFSTQRCGAADDEHLTNRVPSVPTPLLFCPYILWQQIEVEKIVAGTPVTEIKTVSVEVVVTATPTPLPTVAGTVAIDVPTPQSAPGMVVLALGAGGDENGLNQAQSPDNYKEWA